MACIHGAILDVEGGRKCLLCGEFIPDNQEAPAKAQKQPTDGAETAGTGKSAPRKRTPKSAK